MVGRNTVCLTSDKNGERIKNPQLTTKFHFPAKVDEEYMQFCYELLLRGKKGEKIDYAKESRDFWNRKIKEAVDRVETLTDTVVERLDAS